VRYALTKTHVHGFDMTAKQPPVSPVSTARDLRDGRDDDITARLHTGPVKRQAQFPFRFATISLILLALFFASSSHAQTTQSVTLAWDTDTDPTVVGYNLLWGTSSGDYTKTENTPLSIPVSRLLANDTHPNGYALSITGVSNPVNGTVSYNASTQTVTFVPVSGYPSPNYSGPASFT
jgi:Bacterial cadherin-like domain